MVKCIKKKKQEIIERQARKFLETQKMLALDKPFKGLICDFVITEAEENAPHGRVMGRLGRQVDLDIAYCYFG